MLKGACAMGGNNGGYIPSEYEPSLPDNAAENQAAKDAEKETSAEKAQNDAAAKEGAGSFWSSIFGKK